VNPIDKDSFAELSGYGKIFINGPFDNPHGEQQNAPERTSRHSSLGVARAG
jgi:hypothetical protein